MISRDTRQSMLQCPRQCQKHFQAALCLEEFKSEALAAEEMLDHVISSREQFSFQICLESGDGIRTFGNQRY